MEEFKKFMKTEVRLFNGGLIAIGLIILQIWISNGTPDIPSKISLYAIVFSLPMIAADLLYCRMPHIQFGSKIEYSIAVTIRYFSWRGVFLGVVFAVIHTSLIAGLLFMFMSVICYVIYNRVGYYTLKSLEANQKTPN